MSAVEIICRYCGAETFLRREAVYEGFSKVGERLFCASCGKEYASEEEVPFKQSSGTPELFSEDDRPEVVSVFSEEEARTLCRYCAHYVINPFTQFCSVHRKEVQATDSCSQFTPAENR